MKNIKKTTITVETERVIVLSQALIHEHCRQCDDEVGMLGIKEAAMLGGVSPRTIHCQIAEGKLHAREADGQSLVCVRSLTRGSKP
jgi:hypothetical protein